MNSPTQEGSCAICLLLSNPEEVSAFREGTIVVIAVSSQRCWLWGGIHAWRARLWFRSFIDPIIGSRLGLVGRRPHADRRRGLIKAERTGEGQGRCPDQTEPRLSELGRRRAGRQEGAVCFRSCGGLG